MTIWLKDQEFFWLTIIVLRHRVWMWVMYDKFCVSICLQQPQASTGTHSVDFSISPEGVTQPEKLIMIRSALKDHMLFFRMFILLQVIIQFIFISLALNSLFPDKNI
jgi:hypothetical protein